MITPVQPLQRIGEGLRFLDQTRLPTEVLFRDTTDYQEVITAIQRLEIRGAPAIGIAGAYALALALSHVPRAADNQQNIAAEIRAARPTAVNLAWAVDRVVQATHRGVSAGQRPAVLAWQEAETIHDEDRAMCRRIGEFGAAMIPGHATILTHCNTGVLATGGIGTALGIVYTAAEQGKTIRVFADETRPLLQGARLTTWELQQAGIDVTLICDSVAAVLMKQKKIDLVLVGADRIAANGDTANKIGTYALALMAAAHQVPFYVAAPMSTFDSATLSGTDIVIEQRPAEEVTEGFGKRTAPPGLAVYSPAFDITPAGLISGFVTDQGIRPGGRLGDYFR